MKVIVTGATGFIGKALCAELVQAGHLVTAVVRPRSIKADSLPEEVQRLECTLEDLETVEGAFDVFYHLAWNGSSGDDRNEYQAQHKNIQYMENALRAAKKWGCYKFIGAGSQAEYGVVYGVAKEEVTVPNPFMMYGATKLAAYYMGKVLAQQLDISFVWPRLYSIYGVGENAGTLVNYVLDCLQGGEVPRLSACENMWDFMYISDCARALRFLGEQEQTSGLYHVSGGKPRILKEFVKEIRQLVNPDAEVQFGAKMTDSERTFWLEPDVSRMRNLGFQCEISFAQGVLKKMEE